MLMFALVPQLTVEGVMVKPVIIGAEGGRTTNCAPALVAAALAVSVTMSW